MTYGAFLKLNGIHQMEFKLKQLNSSLGHFADIISSIGQYAWKLSQEDFLFYLKIGVLFMEASTAAGTKILSTLFHHYSVQSYGFTSTYRLNIGIEKSQVRSFDTVTSRIRLGYSGASQSRKSQGDYRNRTA